MSSAAVLAWWLSKDAYEDAHEQDDPFGLEWIADVAVPNTLYFARIWKHESRVFVAFRGTPPNGSLWIVNFDNDLVRVPGERSAKVHQGYYKTFDAGMPRLGRKLRSLGVNRRTKVHIVGHSLGGCISYLTAFHLATEWGIAAEVYTFGSPRVGNDEFKNRYNSLVPNTTVVQNRCDGLIRLPSAKYFEFFTTGLVSRFSQSDLMGQLATGLSLLDHQQVEPLSHFWHVGKVLQGSSNELHPHAHFLKNYHPTAQQAFPESIAHAAMGAFVLGAMHWMLKAAPEPEEEKERRSSRH